MTGRLYDMAEVDRIIARCIDGAVERVRKEIERDRHAESERIMREMQRLLGMDPDNPDEWTKDRLWVRQRRLTEGSIVSRVWTVATGLGVMGFVGFVGWAIRVWLSQKGTN